MEDQIQFIRLDLLDDHPDNPRIVWRQEVIDGIAAQLEATGVFDPAHALLVRPMGTRYQIIRGHHRRQAALAVGLIEMPCWVRDMPDGDAYMQLALGNVQGELSPLELGIHALHAVTLSEGGSGKTGGLSEYGRQLGKTKGYVSQVRNAAEVFDVVKPFSQLNGLLDKAQHLTAIHGVVPDLWPLLVARMLDKELSVNQTEDLCKKVNKYAVPDEWQFFLPLLDLVTMYLGSGRYSPEEVAEIVTAVEGIKRLIINNPEQATTLDGFKAWLAEGIGKRAWDKTELNKYRQTVLQAIQDANKPEQANVQTGKWYALGEHRLYCGNTAQAAFMDVLPTAQFAFADPPYNAGVAEWDENFKWQHDYLIDHAEVVVVTPGIVSIASFFREDTRMPYLWSMACWITNGMTRGALGFGNWIYMALFGKGSIHQGSQDVIRVSIKTGESEDENYKGRKPSALLTELLNLFTQPGDTVIDPFLGSGTTLFVADELGRVCYGGEIQTALCNDMINRWQDKTGMQAKVCEPIIQSKTVSSH